MATSVNVIEQCKISPPSGSVPPTSLPLTILDIPWLPLPTVQRLIFYEFHHPKTYFLETILPNIKHSLSLTLQHFPTLAANLAWPQSSSLPEIQYVDGGFVRLTVAESDNDSFPNLVGNQPRFMKDLYPLAPKLLEKSTDKNLPLIALQVTLFPSQGICIGITYNHVVADGRAIHHFIKSWASVCKQSGKLDGEFLLPFHDRSILYQKTNDTICLNYLKKYNIARDTLHLAKPYSVSDSDSDSVLATFIMKPDAIKKLRQWIMSRIEDNRKLHLSSFVLTCAYVWVCLIKARQKQSDEIPEEEDMDSLIFTVDSRSRVEPPLPNTFFGNCLTGIFVKAKTSDLYGKDGILIAAEMIGSAIQMKTNGDAMFKEMEWLLSSSDISFSPHRLFSIAGSPKFGIYETDFGWGNPRKSEVISIAGTGAMSLAECPNEVGGVEVGLARNVGEMEAFTGLFAEIIEDF